MSTYNFPCDINDTVWFIREPKQKNGPYQVKPAIVGELIVTERNNNKELIVVIHPLSYVYGELKRRVIGVDAWLTREEALQHLPTKN